MTQNGSDVLPEWQNRLSAVPEAQRCPSQRDLARGLDLWDVMFRMFAGGPLSPTSPEAFTGVLAGLESEYRSFTGDSVLELHGKDVYKRIVFEGAFVTTVHSGLLEPLNVNRYRPGVPLDKALRVEASSLYMIIITLSFPDGNSPELVSEWAELGLSTIKGKGLFEQMAKHGGDSILAQHGSTLTCKNLADMSYFLGTLLSIKADAGKMPRQVTVDGFHGVLNRMKVDPPCWYTFAHFIRLLYAVRFLREPIDFPDETMFNIIKKYLRDAENTKDPYRIACCKINVAEHLIGRKMWTYDKLEKILSDIKEEERKCQPWFPRFFRKGSFMKVPRFELLLEAARTKHPYDYRERIFPPNGDLVQQANEAFESRPPPTDPRRNKCAQCGIDRLDLSCCSAVSVNINVSDFGVLTLQFI